MLFEVKQTVLTFQNGFVEWTLLGPEPLSITSFRKSVSE